MPRRPAPQLRVPDGWLLVPAAPTEEWVTRLHQRTAWPQVAAAIRMILEEAPRYDGKQ